MQLTIDLGAWLPRYYFNGGNGFAPALLAGGRIGVLPLVIKPGLVREGPRSPSSRRQKDVDEFTFTTSPINEAPVLGDSCGHFYETGKRLGPHFSHDLASMRLYCDLAYPELAADLLIQQTGDDQPHDLLFAVTE